MNRRTSSVPFDTALLERRLSDEQRDAAKHRTAMFLAQCRLFKINVTAKERERAYLEALEEVERGDTDHRMLPPEPPHERRDYSVNYEFAFE